MSYINSLPKDAQQYFSTLPKLVQESIMQSGVSFDDVQQLKEFVHHLDV